MKRIKQSLLVLGVMLMSGVTLLAATSSWTGATGSLWATGNNWSPAGPPATGDDILFPSVANQTVDLAAVTYAIGSLAFNSANPYSLGNGGLTLGGNVSQNSAGAVTLNAGIDLGGANRNFVGSGSGVVTLNNPVTGAGYRAIVNGANYVIANNANTIDGWQMLTGGKAAMVGSATIATYPNASYFGGDGSAGGFYLRLDGGTLNFQATETIDMGWGAGQTGLGSADWQDRAIVFGPNGGTLVYDSITPGWNGPTVYYSQGGTSTLVVGQPLPYSGDPWAPNVGAPTDGTNQYRSPFEVEYGIPLGIYQNTSYTYFDSGNPGATLYFKWRQGSGDFQLILTNGASAYLDWNALTNGNFIVRGHPGGDSSVIETNATGWTRNVGRLAIRGPHRSGVQYSDGSGNYPAGAISRSFCIPQYNGNGMVFYDAVQVWNRDGLERLACDMSFESGSSVDFCSGRRTQVLDLGHPGNASIAGPTNQITIKGGGKLNLNLQMRSQIGEGRTCPRGESAGLRVWSLIDIKDGGQLKIYRSQSNALGLTEVAAGDTGGSSASMATKCIELFRPITGEGNSASDARVVVDLPYSEPSNGSKDGGNNNGKNGVNFDAITAGMGAYPGAELIVNGTGDHGLRLMGQSGYVSNLLANGRCSRVTGTGGTLTVAATSNDSMWIPGGPGSASTVSLGLDSEAGSTPTYILRPSVGLDGFAGLILKGGTAMVEDSTSVTMKTLRLAGSATIQLGTAAGGSMLSFANSSAVAWSAGTLSITSWNGSASGGGSDQIKFGTDITGLTTAQLAQVKWINPYGGGDITGARILATGEIVPPVSAFSIASPAIVNGEFVFTVPGVAGQTSIIQWATNLTPTVNWYNILTNTGVFSFTNTLPYPEVFYRVLVP